MGEVYKGMYEQSAQPMLLHYFLDKNIFPTQANKYIRFWVKLARVHSCTNNTQIILTSTFVNYLLNQISNTSSQMHEILCQAFKGIHV
jgi:hypothetical protein